MDNKYEIIYVYDGLCSWCYGFDSVMEKLYNIYKNQFNFRIVSGGMFIGNSVMPAQSFFKESYRDAYKRVSEISGAKISEDYLTGLIKNENYEINSERPANALTAFRTYPISKGKDFDFIKKLQSLIFFNGLNPNKDTFYETLAEFFDINGKDFLHRMKEEKVIEATYKDFKYTHMLKVSSYPQVFMKVSDEHYYLIAKGYTDFDTLQKRIENVVNELKLKK